MNSSEIVIDLEGSDLKYAFELDATVSSPVELNSHTHKLPTAAFDALSAAAAVWRSSMDGTLEGLATSIATETADRIAAITAEEQRVDALIASGMWLYADQAAFPPAADNHGRVVHSHADAAIFFAHGGTWHQVAKEVDLQSTIASLASEASTREAADNTLQANIDAEAATRAAADTTEANTRSGADAALSGRLDVLEADPTTATAVAAVQADVDQNETDSDAADAALSARLDTLEADPTTATALAAETAARIAGDAAANTYTDDQIAAVIGAAPAVLNTLEEIANSINDDADVYTNIVSQIVSGDTTEATTRAADDAALSARLDVLEADPTTATAVAAVQADVDQNEADADAAIALKLDASAVSAYGLTLVDDADAATARTTLGLGTAATTAASDYATAAQGATADTAAQLDGSNIPGAYNNDTEAAAGGVAVGAIYKNTNGTIHWRVS